MVIAIGQASHAWLSGQLARAWGNERFAPPEPLAEVCLAADQHDVGMASWDLSPLRDPGSGLPYSFMEMPLSEHLRLWTEGPERLVSQSRYGALLVSMHGRRLYERRDLAAMAAEEADAVRWFISRRERFEAAMLRSLGLRADEVAFASQLIWTWDYLSLAICLGWSPAVAREAPAREGPVDIALEGAAISPWPFASPTVAVRCEGRQLSAQGYAGDAELAAALAEAPWVTVEIELRPAHDS